MAEQKYLKSNNEQTYFWKQDFKWYYLILWAAGTFIGFFAAILANLSIKWIIVFFFGIFAIMSFTVVKDKKSLALWAFVFFLPIFATKKIIYSKYLLNPGGPAAIGIFLYDIPMFYLFIVFLFKKIMNRNSSLDLPKIFWPLLLFTLWGGLSIVNATDPLLTVLEFIWQIKMGIMILLLYNIIEDEKDLKLVIIALIAGLFFQEIITFIQAYKKVWFTFTGDVEYTKLETTSSPTTFRAGGTVGWHNVQAGYYAMLIPFAAGIFFGIQKKIHQWTYLFVILCGILAILLTYSRNGYLSLALAFIVVAFLAFKSKFLKMRHIFLILWMIVLMGILLFPFLGKTISQRINSNAAVDPRFESMGIAVNMIKENPIFGIGLNNFALVMDQKKYAPLGVSDLQRTYSGGQMFGIVVHNKYLLIAAQTGVIGILFYLIILVIAYKTAFQLFLRSAPYYKSLSIGLIAALTGASINMCFDIFNAELLISIYWVIIGLIFVVDKLSHQEITLVK